MRSHRKKGHGKARKGKSAHRRVLTVRARPGSASQGLLNIGAGAVLPCALGRAGVSSNKREGDGATPLGRMRLLAVYLAGCGFARRSLLPLRRITSDLGWCEVPDDRNYNRPVRIPYPASHETMLRSDGLYDAVVVLDWNMRPRRRGRGSAIFFHLSRPGLQPTAGCIAVPHQAMRRLLPRLTPATTIVVSR